MNIVNIWKHTWGLRGWGTLYPGVDCPPPLKKKKKLTMFIETRYEKLFPVASWRAFRNLKWPGSSQSLWSLHKNESIHEGWGGGGGTLYPGVDCLHPPTDYVHRDEIWEIVSSILMKGIQKLQMTRICSIPLSWHKNENIHEGWGGWGDTLPRGRLSPHPPSIDYVYRDEIEIVSSIHLKGIQKRQTIRLFSIPFIIT